MRSRYYAHLSLPLNITLRHLATFRCDLTRLAHVSRSAQDVPKKLKHFLLDRGIALGHCEAFYTPPNSQLSIHIDRDRFSELCKLNFSYGAPESKMHWWKFTGSIVPPVLTTGIGTQYIKFDKKNCELADTTSIGTTLVNAGQPHSIENNTAGLRFTFSCVLHDSKTRAQLTLNEAADRLHENEICA